LISSEQENLTGKVALVTGGGTGIGRILAEALGRLECRVVICGRRKAVVDGTAAELRAKGLRLEAVEADVSVDDGIAALAEAIGDVDILINNAATRRIMNWVDVSRQDWRDVMSVNLEAPLRLSQVFIPGMMQRGWGRVVNVASVYGIVAGNPGFYEGMNWDSLAYVVSKHALIGLTKQLAVMVGASGVTVNGLSPGMFPSTEANRSVPEESRVRLASATPVKRLGDLENLQSALEFLVSPRSSFVTGQNLVVDGGWTIW
jgi:NAD(P)-dependent dehydrogenase (short-subunit alcohol dehydrogenase family)